MANIKISQLPAKGANLAADDLLEVSEFTGTGYVSKSITGQEIIDAASGGGAAWGSITGTLSTQTDLQTALDAKQDDLVSGTNIKTINSTSVLGSGNIAVQPTLVSGTNIKTINSTSLLGSGNVAVQDTLVSGTNIKTINSTSLLGSGDLAINSVTGINSLFKPLTGKYQTQFVLGGGFDYNFYGAANFMQLAQYSPASTYTTTEMSVNCVSSIAGQEIKIVIYSDSNGTPSTNLLTSTALSFGTTGIKTFTTSFTFTAGTKYWVGIIQKTNGAAMMSGGYISYLSPIYTDNAFFTYNAISSTTYSYAAPASTISLANFTGFNSNDSASFPLIIFKPA